MPKSSAAALVAGLLLVSPGGANGASSAVMQPVVGANATFNVTITIQTALGSSTDSDSKTMPVAVGFASSAFQPNAPAFTASQLGSMQIKFLPTTFNFQFFCLPFIGCQNLNVTLSELQLTLLEPTCSPIAVGTGAVSYVDALVNTAMNYSTTGLAVTSGSVDTAGTGTVSGRITNPSPATVRLDQLTMATQTFVVDPSKLPAGVNGLTITVQPNLTNTVFSAGFAASPNDFDFDDDGSFDFCDTCTDADGDGYGDSNFPNNTCAIDNCPEAFNPDQLDTNGNGIGDACKPAPPCPSDIAPKGGNSAVDVDDLLLVINSWGACAGCPADIVPPKGNDAVDVDDLLAVINAWGVCE